MPYIATANRKTPALLIYLLDCSGSMNEPDIKLADGSSATRMSVALKAIEDIIIRMIQLSTRGTAISPRYRIGVFAYTSQVIDVLGGIKSIDEVAQLGIPDLEAQNLTNTEAAFLKAEQVLQAEIPRLDPGSPAPLICHMTDGEITMGGDPSPVAERIMQMAVPDGRVLIENIFVGPSAHLLRHPTIEAKDWSGLTSSDELVDEYARRLFNMSSPLPDGYRTVMHEMGYRGLQAGARMMFAGNDQALLKMAFAMSSATPTR